MLDVLRQLYEFMKKNFSIQPDMIIYLKTNPDSLMKRIASRGRNEETKIESTYLQRLHDLHERWIERERENG